jgi:hypothetical protein
MDHREQRGLKRAITRPIDYDFSQQFEYQRCKVQDISSPGQPRSNFRSMGFETIDLTGAGALQSLLAAVNEAGEITPGQASQLRRCLRGRVFQMSQRKCLKMLYIAPEGLIMRKSGPNGLKVDPDVELGQMNGHDAAPAIHGDQDVRGTPLKQMMRGFAPWMFRHQTPDGSNHLSPLVLVNVWIPLHQITRPLTLMDRSTLNSHEHQLRYALPTDSFLDRDQQTELNDIWSFLHDDAQQWYFRSDMGHDQAYVFDTLGTPHGSFILPGEDVAEQYYLQLQQLRRELLEGSVILPPVPVAMDLPSDTTAPLRRAIEAMAGLVATVPLDNPGQTSVDVWSARAAAAMDAVVRKSLEMRVVALWLPDIWPFSRRRTS